MEIFVVREEFSILILVVVIGIYIWYKMTQTYTHNKSHTYQIPGFVLYYRKKSYEQPR